MQVSLKSILPISTDLTFDQHLKSVSGQCFYQLRQLRSVRQSPDTESITTVIRAFVSSRVDYCCSLLIGSPRSVTDKLQRVLNAAARVITNTKKYESGLSRTLHHDLHWLNVTERIQFRLPSGCNSRAYISVCAAWLQRTWLNCVRQSLRQQVVVAVFGPSQPATWSYHTADCQPTAPVRSESLVQSAGMLYRII